MSDVEEPPTKVTRYEMSSQFLEGEVEEDGQEEWLSEGVLTDEDYNNTGEQDQTASNLDTSQDSTVASFDNSMENLTDSHEATDEQNISIDGQNINIGGQNISTNMQTISVDARNVIITGKSVSTIGNTVSTIGNTVSIIGKSISTMGKTVTANSQNVSTIGQAVSKTLDVSLNVQSSGMGLGVTTQGRHFILDGSKVNIGGDAQDFEEELQNMEQRQNDQADFPEELNAFLIRKKDGKLITGDPKVIIPAEDKQSDVEESPKNSDEDDDGNDTDGLLRLLGDDEGKNKKYDDDETADEEDFNLEGSKSKTLRLRKKALVKKYPAKKAVPEDDDITDASSDEEVKVYKMQRKVNKVNTPTATDTKPSNVQHKTPNTSTPVKKYVGKRVQDKASLGSKVPTKPGQNLSTSPGSDGTSLLGTTVKTPVTTTIKTPVITVIKAPLTTSVNTSMTTTVKTSESSKVKTPVNTLVKTPATSRVRTPVNTSVKAVTTTVRSPVSTTVNIPVSTTVKSPVTSTVSRNKNPVTSSIRTSVPTKVNIPVTTVRTSMFTTVKTPVTNTVNSQVTKVKSPMNNTIKSPVTTTVKTPDTTVYTHTVRIPETVTIKTPVVQLTRVDDSSRVKETDATKGPFSGIGTSKYHAKNTQPQPKAASVPIIKKTQPKKNEVEDIEYVEPLTPKERERAEKQLMMMPEEMDEEIPSDTESDTDEESLYDELPSSDDEDHSEWFTLDIRAERAGDYIPLLGEKAEKLLLEEKGRVSEHLELLKKSLSALTVTSRLQADKLRVATTELAELDAQLKAA